VEIKAFSEKEELVFTAKVEYIEKVPAVDWSKISLEVIAVDVMEEDMDRALSEIKDKFKMYKDADAKHAAKKGDAVLVDFHGKIADKDFDGNKGHDVRIELGNNQFIPGFEEQLIGAKAGANIAVRVTFPKNYNDSKVAGKAAVFDVKVKKVMLPETVQEINDDFAKELGLENKEKLLEMIRDKISSDLNGLARLHVKKALFDKIDEVYKFEVPAGMVQLDFQGMWNELEVRKKAEPASFKGRTEADLRAEYMEIAKRRVRLGVILAELAKENDIEVTEADLRQAMFAEAMMRPGQESMILDFYSKPENLDRLKGPILEEKAVDYVLSQIQKIDVAITSKEFFEKYAPALNVPSNN
jgi:trigger factor